MHRAAHRDIDDPRDLRDLDARFDALLRAAGRPRDASGA
jgi:hypothetical protein